MISGMIIRNSGYNEGEHALMFSFDENQKNLVNKFINDNINQEFDFIVYYLTPEGEYSSSRTFHSKIEKFGETYVIIEEYDLHIQANDFSCIRPVKEGSLLVFENFDKQLCDTFGCEYIELDI